ncbi:MAG: hypothetical protein GXO83_10160 [Chlorobi bacterium]|nr:hypothetical protein [Chlorobiota bacterium]
MKKNKEKGTVHLSGSAFAVSLIFLLTISTSGNSQTSKDTFIKTEIRLRQYFDTIRTSRSDKTKAFIADTIFGIFSTVLDNPESFTYPFDSLENVGKIFPPDSGFRVLNWNIPNNDGTHLYYLMLQFPDTTAHTIKVTAMKSALPERDIPENKELTPEQWYGALYYEILENRTDTVTWYTLLGIRYHDFFTTKKVIDILWFQKDGTPQFGAPVFVYPDHTSYRVVFEFSAHVSMLLHYDQDLKMIIFDHLSPSRPSYKGMYQFYGPDFSYDGFIFKKGKWYYREDLDVRNQEIP